MVTITTDNNLSASSTLQRTNDETGYQLNASLTPPADGGWGWNLAASQQASRQSGQGEVGYLGRYGKAYAGFSRLPDNHYGYAGATGSLVTMACLQQEKSIMVLPSSQLTACLMFRSNCKIT